MFLERDCSKFPQAGCIHDHKPIAILSFSETAAFYFREEKDVMHIYWGAIYTSGIPAITSS